MFNQSIKLNYRCRRHWPATNFPNFSHGIIFNFYLCLNYWTLRDILLVLSSVFSLLMENKWRRDWKLCFRRSIHYEKAKRNWTRKDKGYENQIFPQIKLTVRQLLQTILCCCIFRCIGILSCMFHTNSVDGFVFVGIFFHINCHA